MNKAKGEPVMNKASDFEGTQPQRLNFQIAFPGTYKVEALLTDAAGNRIDSKSEIITVIGEPPSGDGDRDREDRDRNADRDKASEPEREHEQERDKPQK